MNKLLTLLIVIFMIFGCGENFTDKNTTNSTEQGGSNTGDNTGSGSDNGNTGDNTGNGSDSDNTGDNTGDGSDSGDTGNNTGNGSDSGDTGDNSGDGSDSGDTGDNSGDGSDSGDTGNNTGNGSDGGDTGDNSGDGSDNGDTGNNTGNGSDSGDTGDNTGNGSDSGDTGDNSGDGSDSGDTGDNSGDGSDSGDTGDNTGDDSDSGDTGDNSGDGSDSGDTGDNSGDGSDSGDTGDNTPSQPDDGSDNENTDSESEIVDNVISISIKSCENTTDKDNNIVKLCELEINELTLDLTNKISAIIQGDAKPQNAANRLVYYSVEPSTLASIDGNGNVTAQNTGIGTITVQSDSNPEIKKSIPLTITNSAEEQGEIIPVQAIGFEETSLILQMGETYKLTPKFTPVNTTERDFECSVGNLADFVDVNKDTCEITGKKLTTYNGLVEIKSKNKALSGTISPVTVVDKKISLENFSITPKSITVDKGEQAFLLTDKFNVTYNPADTNEKDFNYSSNNSDILFNVSGSRFRPDNIGVATITVTSKFHPEMFEEVIVNVKNPYDTEPPVYSDINPSDMASHSDRMYIKIMFDVISSNGDIKNNEGSRGIHQIDVQPNGKNGIELITENMNGYISNYGFCEKYGCMQRRPENENIAVKSSGINYYVGHNDLYIPVRSSGKSTYDIYTIFSFGSFITEVMYSL